MVEQKTATMVAQLYGVRSTTDGGWRITFEVGQDAVLEVNKINLMVGKMLSLGVVEVRDTELEPT